MTQPHKTEMIDDATGETAAVAFDYSLDGEVIYSYPDGEESTEKPEYSHPGNMIARHLPDGRYYYE